MSVWPQPPMPCGGTRLLGTGCTINGAAGMAINGAAGIASATTNANSNSEYLPICLTRGNKNKGRWLKAGAFQDDTLKCSCGIFEIPDYY